MRKYRPFNHLFACGFMIALWGCFIACEDIIELELNDADAAIVIVGEISNQHQFHDIRIHRTVPVSAEGSTFDPVSAASVQVTDQAGRANTFHEVEPGLYRSDRFRGVIGRTYHLHAEIEGQLYEASSTMPRTVMVDSIGTGTNDFIGSDHVFVTLKFRDPAGEPNFYRYTIAVNDSLPRYVNVYDDKFNDGLTVAHELITLDLSLNPGDRVLVQRQHIDENVFRYWRAISSANPGAAAPANPPSNISNGALGYFSAQSINEFIVHVPE